MPVNLYLRLFFIGFVMYGLMCVDYYLLMDPRFRVPAILAGGGVAVQPIRMILWCGLEELKNRSAQRWISPRLSARLVVLLESKGIVLQLFAGPC